MPLSVKNLLIRYILQLFSKIEDDISIINNEEIKSHELYEKYKELYERACRDNNQHDYFDLDVKKMLYKLEDMYINLIFKC